jgi:hypothetical protein
VPNAGHWRMEEAPAPTIAAVRDFLAARHQAIETSPGGGNLKRVSSSGSSM